jgi:hypothetical protein
MAVTKEESRLNSLECGMEIEVVQGRVVLSGEAKLLQPTAVKLLMRDRHFPVRTLEECVLGLPHWCLWYLKTIQQDFRYNLTPVTLTAMPKCTLSSDMHTTGGCLHHYSLTNFKC